jgi:hypothetical protein
MVSFTPQLPYSLRKNLWYTLDKDVRGLRIDLDGVAKKKNSLPLSASKSQPSIPQPM